MNHHFATPIPWETRVKGPRYGSDDTYRMAAEWLSGCVQVADWGGCLGYFQNFLPKETHYTVVDGTSHEGWPPNWIVADLAKYSEPSQGILLRHVLEMTPSWREVLDNALAAFTERMVVVTFTPDVPRTRLATNHLTWPVHHFAHGLDLIPQMRPYLIRYESITVKKTLPERVYYLEK